MIHRTALWVGVAWALGAVWAPGAAWAQKEALDARKTDDSEAVADALRGEIAKLTIRLYRAEALAEEITAETTALDASAQSVGGPIPELSADQSIWDQVFKNEAGDSVATRLLELRNRLIGHEPAAIKAWRAAREQSEAFELMWRATEVRAGRSLGSTGSNVVVRVMDTSLGPALLAVVGGILLTVHENRYRFRWRARALASRPSIVGLAVGLTLAMCGPVRSADTLDALARRRDEIKAKLDETEEAARNALAMLQDRLEKIRRERVLYGLKPETPKADSQAKAVIRAAKDMQDQFRDLRVSARLTDRLLTEADQLNKEVDDGKTKLSVFGASMHRESLVTLAACSLLALAAMAPLSISRRRHRRKLNEDSRECPRCLCTDTLKPFGQSTGEGDDDPTVHLPKTRLVVCDACDFEIRENYVRMNRLCFPTVGIRSSGKTHWLANLYDQIRNKDLDVKSVIKKIASRADDRFNELVEALKYDLRRPSGTVFALPYPLTFHVHDNDPLGRNRTTVNMFDYAGDLDQFTIEGDADANEFRRRALLSEGFALFLDPAQVMRTTTDSIDSQIRCLQQFTEELHAMCGIPSEQPIDLPIAVCVSKIDLLVSHNPLGTEAVSLIRELRETMGGTPSLRLIEQRSQLIARALPRIFPGWGVERDLRESFGGRYMFFPMSAVGLEESELGIDDLAERQVTPFGTLEPLLWLLHMHGYCVLC